MYDQLLEKVGKLNSQSIKAANLAKTTHTAVTGETQSPGTVFEFGADEPDGEETAKKLNFVAMLRNKLSETRRAISALRQQGRFNEAGNLESTRFGQRIDIRDARSFDRIARIKGVSVESLEGFKKRFGDQESEDLERRMADDIQKIRQEFAR